MAKTIEVSDNKAFRIEAVKINGQQMISIRQMYKRKTDKDWQHAKQGVTLPLEVAATVSKWVTKYATSDETVFKEIEISRKGKNDE